MARPARSWKRLTRDHGRHLGLVRGGASRRDQPALQPGNSSAVGWRARLAEHLGSFTVELAQARAGDLMESRDGAGRPQRLFRAWRPRRCRSARRMQRVFTRRRFCWTRWRQDDFAHWAPLYVRWEAGLLEALGFGLDLSRLRRHRRDGRSHLCLAAHAAARCRAGRARLCRAPVRAAGVSAGLSSMRCRPPPDIAAGPEAHRPFPARAGARPHGRECRRRALRLDALADSRSE